MPFDLSTAQPIGFDLSTAEPVKPKFGSGKSFDAINGQLVPTGSDEAKAAQDPSAGGSTLKPIGFDTGIPLSQGMNRFLAGAGKATTDIGRGVGQMIGLESRKDVAASRALDAPLMRTGAGKAGFIAGTAADALPAAFIPGANTMLGAGAIGAGMGLMQPSTSTGETARNTLFGGAAGPASLLVGRGVGALYQGAKSAIEPLFRGGQERVAARTLQAFAGGPQEAQQAASSIANAGPTLPGVQPTAAEVANNAGIAQLERSLRNNPEYLNALTQRNQANRAAMTGALDQIAGTPQALTAATGARSAATEPLYRAASGAQIQGDEQLANLMTRPSMQAAWRRAQQLAAERGEPLVSGIDAPEHVINSSVLDATGQPAFKTTIPATAQTYSGRAVQYLKMGLNDMLDTAEQRGMGAHENSALTTTRADLNRWITSNVPALRQADTQFARLSQPVNQMQVGGALRDRLVPALGDFGNNTRLSANSYANALRNGDQLAATATGQPQLGLNDVLNPGQMQTVNQVGQQLARRANADELGRAVGSNTAQNLVSQNVIRQFLGPLGLPQSLGERAAQSTLGQTVLRPLQFTAQLGERGIMGRLADAALSPQEAQRLLTLAQRNPRLAQALWARQGLLGPLGNTAQRGLLGSDASQQ
jgi:hypothetical protein